jgi:DNA transformation protein
MTNSDVRDDILARLEGLPVRARPMFGGYGLYLEDRYFGVIGEGRLYFRTDDESRADYLAFGSVAFQPSSRPRGPTTVGRNFEVPAEVLADPSRLREWALRAASARR